MKKVLILILALFASTAYAQSGLGKSTLTCLDKDGDGYGQGSGCTGPDADDNDASVHSASDVTAKYGSINGFLVYLGYQSTTTPATVWCISPTGNDGTAAASTNADTACKNPYLTYNAAAVLLSAPYIVLFRQGTFTQAIYEPPSGTATQQNVIMSYPGEKATIDFSAGIGNTINVGAKSYITVDGLKIVSNPSGSGYNGGTYILYNTGPQTILFVGNVLRRCEISGGGGDSNVDADNVTNFIVEENIIHDPYPQGGQHNVYIGSNTVASTGVIIRRNILYNVYTGGYPNLQFNGRCTGCYFEQNLLYNADGQQIALLQGVSNSYVRGNLAFNTGTAGNPPLSLTMANYDSGQCQMVGLPSICAWDQTGNVIENNTFWGGTTGPGAGGSPVNGETVLIANNSTVGPCGNGASPPCGNMGGNFYRNNIIVDLAGSMGDPPVMYFATNPANYLALDTWVDNLIVNSAGSSTYVVASAGTAYTCASLNSMAVNSSGCSTASPGFVNVSASYFNTPSLFNFSLVTGSPAIGGGSAAGAPAADLWGNPIGNPPAIGAVALSGPAPPVTSLSCTPSNLTSGAAAACTVTLGQAAGTGGASVALSSNAAALTVPASVLAAAGSLSASFTATAGTISAGQSAAVTATYNGGSATAPVTLTGPTTLTSVVCNPSSVASATATTCTVTLTGPAGGTVALSSNATALTVPANVSVPAGATTVSFTATAGTVSTGQTAVVTAVLNGVSQTASVSVTTASSSGSGGWTQLSNTLMQSVCPPDNFGGMTYAFSTGCYNVMAAWSGGAADTKRNRLLMWGGGGPDYYGNEVYSLNLSTNPPAMSRLTNPSVFATTGCPETNADGTPASRHSYNDLVYIPGADVMFDFSGRIAPCDGPSNHTWTLDLSVTPPVWHSMDPVNGFNPMNVLASGGGVVCAYDPNTANVICADPAGGLILSYKYSTNTYTQLNSGQNVPFASTGVIDPVRKLMIFMGHEYQATNPVIKVLDISSGSSFTVQDWTSQVTGCDVLASADTPGLAYDPAIDRTVGFPNTGNAVYLFNPDTKSCVPQTFANGPVVAERSNGAGTYGRFQYFPALDTFAVVSNINQNAFTLKLSGGSSAAPLSCDLNSDGAVNVTDVQIAVNQALGITQCGTADLLQTGVCSVVDVQRVITASLGGSCRTGP